MVFLVAMGVLLVPIVMIVFGWLLYTRGPKEINPVYGYRTKRSMKSPEAWRFAQKFFGRIWLVTGIVLAAVGLLFLFFVWRQMGDAQEGFVFGISFAEIAVMLGAILPTEIALRQRFDEDRKPYN